MLREIQIKDFPALSIDAGAMDTADFLIGILQAPRKEGTDIASMRQTSKVLDAIESAKACGAKRLLLDESLWTFLKVKVETNLWAFYHKTFIEVTDSVLNAAVVDPNA